MNRRCLPLNEWPVQDRTLWEAALSPKLRLGGGISHAVRWRVATRHKLRRGYGRWLSFVQNDPAVWALGPAERVTAGRLTAYVDLLRAQGLSPTTVAMRVEELGLVLAGIIPGFDDPLLRRFRRDLEIIADDQRPPRQLLVTAHDVLSRLWRELDDRSAPKGTNDPLPFRDALIIAFLVLTPLRRTNLTHLTLGEDLVQSAAGAWEIRIAARQAKGRHPIRLPLPDQLTQALTNYLVKVRPLLANGNQNKRLWLTKGGTPLSIQRLYLMVTQRTQAWFGQRLSPHAFRRIAATSLTLEDPEALEQARALLGHSSVKTTTEHYVLATSLKSSRSHSDLIAALRRRYKRPDSTAGTAARRRGRPSNSPANRIRKGNA